MSPLEKQNAVAYGSNKLAHQPSKPTCTSEGQSKCKWVPPFSTAKQKPQQTEGRESQRKVRECGSPFRPHTHKQYPYSCPGPLNTSALITLTPATCHPLVPVPSQPLNLPPACQTHAWAITSAQAPKPTTCHETHRPRQTAQLSLAAEAKHECMRAIAQLMGSGVNLVHGYSPLNISD